MDKKIYNLTIVVPHTGKRFSVASSDRNLTSRDLLNAMANKFNLPAGTNTVLIRKLTMKQLLPDQSLGDVGIEDGETLVADFERTAGCFLPDVCVKLANHKQIAIRYIKEGDELLSLDPSTGTLVTGIVTGCFSDTTFEYLILNGSIKVTPSHLFFANGQWVRAGNLKMGDYLLNTSGKRVRLSHVALQQEKSPVFNLHISNNHTFFVENILVHNLQSKLSGDPLVSPRPPSRSTEEKEKRIQPSNQPKRCLRVSQGNRGLVIEVLNDE